MGKTWHDNYEMGKQAFEDNNYSEALGCFEAVVKEKDGFADVYNMLGLIHFTAGNNDKAVGSFKKAVEINPHYTEAFLNLSLAYNETGQFDKAMNSYESAKNSKMGETSNDSYPDTHVMDKIANMHAELAATYKDIGLYDDACTEYNKALKIRPEFVDIRKNLGMVYREIKDYENSLSELEEAVKVNPDYSPARLQLGLT